ncbi:S1/P1 nuclease [Patiriisocius hiemis]|uniref:S1/P1 nuclease n=1 Tax=Patiriisocius hiemis TaxID=3075604 RepID=A0ABU2Y856_9FLAO|nr:S1/P1 nuclease [Constantimarinum sp. W242]MDT0554378.1 S1/P1 nuclease [Constantimarinum sp. W242]
MKKTYLLFFAFILISSTSLAIDDWGKTGHRVTGEIAEKYLSKNAKKAIESLLNGESLAFVSTYGDEIKSDDAYRKYGPWHYVNFPFDSAYETHPKSDRGDIIVAINTCIKVLKSKTESNENKAFHLRLLVHFIGDLHQPLHIGLAEDKGGNDFQVRWFNEGTNLHTVWDTKMIEHYNMSYKELASNTRKLSKQELSTIKSGSVLDWMNESRAICKDVYENTEVGEKLGYRYMHDYFTTVRSQLQKGGIRLATILNEIFE